MNVQRAFYCYSIRYWPYFPTNLLDKILPQAITTLNSLRMSYLNPQLSTYTQLRGDFSYNHTSIAPKEIQLFIHGNLVFGTSYVSLLMF